MCTSFVTASSPTSVVYFSLNFVPSFPSLFAYFYFCSFSLCTTRNIESVETSTVIEKGKVNELVM